MEGVKVAAFLQRQHDGHKKAKWYFGNQNTFIDLHLCSIPHTCMHLLSIPAVSIMKSNQSRRV